MLEEVSTVTQFDVAVIIIIILSSVFAFIRGFLKEILILTGWIGAGAITFFAFPHAAAFIDDFFKSSKVVNIAAITLVFLAVLTLISIINTMILDNLREMRLGAIDRSLGLLFGLLRGVVLASIIHFAVIVLHEGNEPPDWLSDGETYNITTIGANIIREFAEDFKDGDLKEKAGKIIEENLPAIDDEDGGFFADDE